MKLQCFFSQIDMNTDRLTCSITYLSILGLACISTAQAGLPVIEGPKSSVDKTFYGQISGYINDGVVLGGLILAAVALLTVANAIITTFAEVRDGKSTWAKFGMLVVVGIILLVTVIFLVTKAATVLLG